MTARNEHSKVQASGAADAVAPASVHEAGEALQSAEEVYEDDPGSKAERSYAYLSTRKSQLALAKVREAEAREQQALAEQAQGANEYDPELAQTQSDLRDALVANIMAQALLRQMQAESRMAAPEAPGEVVIRRTGVFFETGEAELSPAARKQLDIVASELLADPSSDETRVEGYADARGDVSMNLQLSQQRADAVREYLVSRGVPGERLRAIGLGERDPIVSNDTPVGLATNRRVEVATPRAGDEQRQNVSGTDADSAGDPEQQEPPEPEPQQPPPEPEQ